MVDWQIGVYFVFLGEGVVVVCEKCYEMVVVLVEFVVVEDVDCMFVVGDVFDLLDLLELLFRWVLELFVQFGFKFVVLLLGNYDFVVLGGVWDWVLWKSVLFNVVCVMFFCEFEFCEGLVIYFCFVCQKMSCFDLMQWIFECVSGDEWVCIGFVYGLLDVFLYLGNFLIGRD